MSRQEITNSQDYKATKAALEWWYSLPEEQRKATDIDAEPDIIDAYSDGVIYGWNNPNWISVKDELPKETGWYLVATPTLNSKIDVALWDGKWHRLITITHWMPLPQPPRKEE